MKFINIFSNREIGVRNYLVTENYGTGHVCNIGVILGMERILVIDSGLGMGGNIRKYIEQFAGCSMPIFTMSTHGGADCVGGIHLFDEAYLNQADWGMKDSFDLNKRIELLEQYCQGNRSIADFGKLLATDNSKVALKNMKQGDHLHLGGVHVEVFELPGRTAGSCVIRVTREGVARTSFVGDAFHPCINDFSNMNKEELTAYAGRLRKLADIMETEEPMYCTHDTRPMTRTTVIDVAEGIEQIASGYTDMDVSAGNGKKYHYHNNICVVYAEEEMACH